jgi:hypothetical protein
MRQNDDLGFYDEQLHCVLVIGPVHCSSVYLDLHIDIPTYYYTSSVAYAVCAFALFCNNAKTI